MNLPAALRIEPRRHLLSVDDVMRMVEIGVIDEGARIELIEGELIDMPPTPAPHCGTVGRLTRIFVRATNDDEGLVWVQSNVRLSHLNLPQPDLVLLKPQPQDYTDRLPTAEDVLLAIEVADSTLHYDRKRKAPLYARLGVPELWIVDLNGQEIIRLRQPTEAGYQLEDRISGRCAPEALPQCVVDLDGLLPSAPEEPGD